MANTIRQDVVQIKFDIDNDPLVKLTKEIDAIKKVLTGSLGTDAFEDIGDEAAKAKKDVDKLKDSVEDTTEEVEDLGKKAGGTGFNGLKKMASVTFKAVAIGITATSAAVIGLTKQAVSAYAEFEQLEGGVETLFKDSADIVMKNANNAFKTSGLSANDYMNTVTSFSASLIQSLNGDTEKAAKLSEKAIVDMSDNANKMGTDMGSIQYAYQGFAKQNYTMLDNLNVGGIAA